MDKENESVDYSLLEDEFNPIPQESFKLYLVVACLIGKNFSKLRKAKSTELINRKRPNALADKSNMKMADLSALSGLTSLNLTASTKANDSALSVMAGTDFVETPRFVQLFVYLLFYSLFLSFLFRPDYDSFFSNKDKSETPSWLRSADRQNFESLAKEAAEKSVTPLSRCPVKNEDYVRGDFHAYRTPEDPTYDSLERSSEVELEVQVFKL